MLDPLCSTVTLDRKNESVPRSKAKGRRLRGAALRKRLWLAVERTTDCAGKNENKQRPSADDSARDDFSLRLYHWEALLYEIHWLFLGRFRTWHENVAEVSATQTEVNVQNESKHKTPEVEGQSEAKQETELKVYNEPKQAVERKGKVESMEQTDQKFQIEPKQEAELKEQNESMQEAELKAVNKHDVELKVHRESTQAA